MSGTDQPSNTMGTSQLSDIDPTKMKSIYIGGKKIDLPLIGVCTINFLLNAATSVILPFFPGLAEGQIGEKKLNVSPFMVGMVIGVNPIGGWIFGFIAGKILMIFGRKKMMLLCLFVSAITITAMGMTYLLQDNQALFLTVALTSRFFMGMARSGYGSTTFAYAPILWPHKTA
mmetsp:Transcript_121397/g.170710  ORF Transcript_121397/g.170710 Transcript_121397/m.170710 type:complete len:173 (-) Transcript_121397:1129-1647(-)